MQDLSSGGKKALEFGSLQRTRLLPINCASSGRTSVKATLKCTGFRVVEPVQLAAVEFPPCNAFHTATGKPAVAVSQTKAILLPPAVVQALVGMLKVPLPVEPVPKNSR